MNFHYDDSFNHIMSGKAANHCLLKNTHVLHTQNEACASAFLSLHSYTMKKYAISFYFRNSASWKVKAFGFLFFFFFFHYPNSSIFCKNVHWAEMSRRGVCNISGFTTPPLLPRKLDCSISPLSHSCSSPDDAELTWCHRCEGPVTSFWRICVEIRGIMLGIFLPVTLGVHVWCCSCTHTHAPVHKYTELAVWIILQVCSGNVICNMQKYYLW